MLIRRKFSGLFGGLPGSENGRTSAVFQYPEYYDFALIIFVSKIIDFLEKFLKTLLVILS
jgi:hypothetical protein